MRVTTPCRSPVSLMVSSTILTARSRSSGGCRCPDPCFDAWCFDAAMGYILPKNAASIEPRAVHYYTHYFRTDGRTRLGVLRPTGRSGEMLRPRAASLPTEDQRIREARFNRLWLWHRESYPLRTRIGRLFTFCVLMPPGMCEPYGRCCTRGPISPGRRDAGRLHPGQRPRAAPPGRSPRR